MTKSPIIDGLKDAVRHARADETPSSSVLDLRDPRIGVLERVLQSWLNSNDAMGWLDDDSPLVVQTKNLLGR